MTRHSHGDSRSSLGSSVIHPHNPTTLATHTVQLGVEGAGIAAASGRPFITTNAAPSADGRVPAGATVLCVPVPHHADRRVTAAVLEWVMAPGAPSNYARRGARASPVSSTSSPTPGAGSEGGGVVDDDDDHGDARSSGSADSDGEGGVGGDEAATTRSSSPRLHVVQFAASPPRSASPRSGGSPRAGGASFAASCITGSTNGAFDATRDASLLDSLWPGDGGAGGGGGGGDGDGDGAGASAAVEVASIGSGEWGAADDAAGGPTDLPTDPAAMFNTAAPLTYSPARRRRHAFTPGSATATATATATASHGASTAGDAVSPELVRHASRWALHVSGWLRQHQDSAASTADAADAARARTHAAACTLLDALARVRLGRRVRRAWTAWCRAIGERRALAVARRGDAQLEDASTRMAAFVLEMDALRERLNRYIAVVGAHRHLAALAGGGVAALCAGARDGLQLALGVSDVRLFWVDAARDRLWTIIGGPTDAFAAASLKDLGGGGGAGAGGAAPAEADEMPVREVDLPLSGSHVVSVAARRRRVQLMDGPGAASAIAIAGGGGGGGVGGASGTMTYHGHGAVGVAVPLFAGRDDVVAVLLAQHPLPASGLAPGGVATGAGASGTTTPPPTGARGVWTRAQALVPALDAALDACLKLSQAHRQGMVAKAEAAAAHRKTATSAAVERSTLECVATAVLSLRLVLFSPGSCGCGCVWLCVWLCVCFQTRVLHRFARCMRAVLGATSKKSVHVTIPEHAARVLQAQWVSLYLVQGCTTATTPDFSLGAAVEEITGDVVTLESATQPPGGGASSPRELVAVHSAGVAGSPPSRVQFGQGLVGSVAAKPRVIVVDLPSNAAGAGGGAGARAGGGGGAGGAGDGEMGDAGAASARQPSARTTLLAPIVDENGRVMGVLQAVNKKAPSGRRYVVAAAAVGVGVGVGGVPWRCSSCLSLGHHCGLPALDSSGSEHPMKRLRGTFARQSHER